MGCLQRSLYRWSTACVMLVALHGVQAQAVEYIANQAPAPDSVEELHGPIVVAFPEKKPPPTGLLSAFSDHLEQFPPFLSDLMLDANFRSYYFLRDNGDVMPPLITRNEAWAGGGSISLQSGLLWDTVAVGGEYFASIPIAASDSRAGTGLLKPIQDTISVLGQAYVRATFGEQVVTLGRQRLDLPYLNGNDGRMVPNTFLGYTVDGRWSHGRFFAGYVDKIKLRPSDTFISISERAGVANSDEGMWVFGMRYEWDNNFLGAIASVIPDVLSTIYSEFDTRWSSGDWGFRLGAQLTDQRSIGDHLLTGARFNTQSLGARMSVSVNNAILTTVFTYNTDGARLRSPFGGDPSFSSLMLNDFSLANQKTLKLGLSYTGTQFGFPGISGFVNYGRGVDAEVGGSGTSLPDDEEIDLTLDFRRSQAPLDGLWLRLRYAVLNPGTSRERYNIRVTLNWGFPLL